MTPKTLTFTVRTESVKYGDGLTFIEYEILMFHGRKLAGLERGPRRSTLDRKGAAREARRRISTLRSHRLFAIRVSRKHISDGEARNCNACAIAQALWHNQERMGLPKREFSFEVSPYGAFAGARGIVQRSYREEIAIPATALPLIVSGSRGGRIFSDSMAEWAMGFDDWAESRYVSLAEWREERGYDDGERPYRPSPCSFVLDLDAFAGQELT